MSFRTSTTAQERAIVQSRLASVLDAGRRMMGMERRTGQANPQQKTPVERFSELRLYESQGAKEAIDILNQVLRSTLGDDAFESDKFKPFRESASDILRHMYERIPLKRIHAFAEQSTNQMGNEDDRAKLTSAANEVVRMFFSHKFMAKQIEALKFWKNEGRGPQRFILVDLIAEASPSEDEAYYQRLLVNRIDEILPSIEVNRVAMQALYDASRDVVMQGLNVTDEDVRKFVDAATPDPNGMTSVQSNVLESAANRIASLFLRNAYLNSVLTNAGYELKYVEGRRFILAESPTPR